jgi:hypothetical protein
MTVPPDTDTKLQRSTHYGWVALLYVFVTLLVNLGAIAAIPHFITPAIAQRCLPFYILPVVWAGYLLLRYRSCPLRWVSYAAALPALYWLMTVISNIEFLVMK